MPMGHVDLFCTWTLHINTVPKNLNGVNRIVGYSKGSGNIFNAHEHVHIASIKFIVNDLIGQRCGTLRPRTCLIFSETFQLNR